MAMKLSRLKLCPWWPGHWQYSKEIISVMAAALRNRHYNNCISRERERKISREIMRRKEINSSLVIYHGMYIIMSWHEAMKKEERNKLIFKYLLAGAKYLEA